VQSGLQADLFDCKGEGGLVRFVIVLTGTNTQNKPLMYSLTRNGAVFQHLSDASRNSCEATLRVGTLPCLCCGLSTVTLRVSLL
jgi:hypothetical protein